MIGEQTLESTESFQPNGDKPEVSVERIKQATARVWELTEKNGIIKRSLTKAETERKIRKQTSLYGQNSIVHLLPSNSRLFNNISNTLIRNGVHTRQKLAETPLEDISAMRMVGDIQLEVIEAMRELAQAELGIGN